MGLYERRVRAISTESSAHTRRKADARARSDRRAHQRLAWATFIREFDGSLPKCREAMIQAMEAGKLMPPFLKPGQTIRDATPSLFTLGEWRRLPDERLSVERLRHKPSGGRPRTPWHPEVTMEFEQQISAGRFERPAALHKHLKRFATARGLPYPPVHQVHHRMGDVPLLRRVVARHGKRAGIADAANHGAVPATYAHEIWVLDELDLPVWVKTYSFEAQQIVAVKPVVILVVDGASGVVVSYYVANPLARGALRGADRDDVMATVLSGCFPELARPACVRYAGWKPTTLRYDRAPIHSDSRQRLRDIGVNVPELPGYAPWARGQVEAVVNIIKAAVVAFHGYDKLFSVAEYASPTDLTTREAAVRSGDRIPEVTPVLVQDMWSMQRLADELDTVIREFNEDQLHDRTKMPRAASYGLALDSTKLVSGRDATSCLIPHRVKVQKNGIRVNRIPFEAAGKDFQFPVGSRVDIRIDPAFRGIFAESAEGMRFLRPAREAALHTDPADVVHRMNSIVSFYDQQSRAAKEFIRQREIGLEQSELADAIAEEQLDAGTVIASLHKSAFQRGETLRPARGAAKKPAKGRTAQPARASQRPVASAPPPGVTPITRAPSLVRPAAVTTGTGPVVRRGIIKTFG